MIQWVLLADMGTALGTMILALATFGSIRGANRSARVAEQGVLDGMRPLVLASRTDAPGERVGFQDDHWLEVSGGHATAEATDHAVYFAIALRNVGHGLAVLNAWTFRPDWTVGTSERPALDSFRRQARAIYLPPNDLGAWQGAMRDPSEPAFSEAAGTVARRSPFAIDVLYGDGEGGQRVITRFALSPRDDGSWLSTVARHWNLDRDDPR